MVSACQSRLPEYSDLITLRIYGQKTLGEDDLSSIDMLAAQYADCLFTINDKTNTTVLKRIAPDEDLNEWNNTYKKNRTESILKTYQLLNIYEISSEKIDCLCVCEAEYADWQTPREEYLFIVEISMAKRSDEWKITSSSLLGTAQKSNTVVIRDDITDEIKFIGKACK